MSSAAASWPWSKSPPTISTCRSEAIGFTRTHRSGATTPRRTASASGKSATSAGNTSPTCFWSSWSVAVIPMYTGSEKRRMAAAVFSPSAVWASSQTTTPYTSRLIWSACLMNHA